MGVLSSPLESSSRDRELKFPLRANRNLTLPITPLSPQGSTLGRALEEIASDVIYFTVLFLSFSFLPPSCSHIFSWCLLSLAVAWVATSQKYWFLPSLLFFFLYPPPLYNPSSSFSFPVLHLSLWVDARPTHFTGSSSRFILSLFPFLSPDFFPWDFILTSRCGFAVFDSTLRYGVAENRSRGCGVVGEFFSGITSLYSSLHPSKPQRPLFRHLACCQPQPLTTHSPWQHTNNCKLLLLVRSLWSEMSFFFFWHRSSLLQERKGPGFPIFVSTIKRGKVVTIPFLLPQYTNIGYECNFFIAWHSSKF